MYKKTLDIESNLKPICARCGQRIVPANNSGWEVFVAKNNKSQPICIFCLEEYDQGGEKAKE